MKQIATTLALSFLGIGVWQLSYRLSSDALAMAIGLTFGLLVCGGLLLLVVVSQRHEPVRRDEDAPRAVYITYNVTNDNRQIAFGATEDMPLLADMARERNGWLPPGHSGMRD